MNGKIEEFIYIPVIVSSSPAKIESSISPGVCEGGSMFFEIEKMAQFYLEQVLQHPNLSAATGKVLKFKRIDSE